MTKSPLVFLSGPKSIFYNKASYSHLPRFLEEHGYQVIILPLPFRSKTWRQSALLRWLTQHETKKFHFVFDSITSEEFQPVLPTEQVASCTTISENPEVAEAFVVLKKPEPLSYKLHRYLNKFYNVKTAPYSETFLTAENEVYQRFLDRCIELAENEWIHSNE